MASDTFHTNVEAIDVRDWDIWQEQDPRHPRFVRVTRVTATSVLIHEVLPREGGDFERAPRAVERYAQLKRFNGKRSGYALHYRSDEKDLAP